MISSIRPSAIRNGWRSSMNRGELSYGELYRRALTLSLQLRQHADIRADTIAVMVDKGRAQIIAVLAILMAGRRLYLPLEGAWRNAAAWISSRSRRSELSSAAGWATSGEARLLTIDPQGPVTALPPAAPGEPVCRRLPRWPCHFHLRLYRRAERVAMNIAAR